MDRGIPNRVLWFWQGEFTTDFYGFGNVVRFETMNIIVKRSKDVTFAKDSDHLIKSSQVIIKVNGSKMTPICGYSPLRHPVSSQR
jgi:hypothetical protein